MPPRYKQPANTVSHLPSAYELFAARFRRSRRGNLWRKYGDMNLTVFPSTFDDGYSFCIADRDVTFSDDSYATEEEAIEALWQAVGRPVN